MNTKLRGCYYGPLVATQHNACKGCTYTTAGLKSTGRQVEIVTAEVARVMMMMDVVIMTVAVVMEGEVVVIMVVGMMVRIMVEVVTLVVPMVVIMVAAAF